MSTTLPGTLTELERARAQIAALEQLLEVFEGSSLEQNERLEQSLARERAVRAEAEDARAALEASEARFRLALGAGRMGAWEWDIVHQRVFWSAELEEIYGLEPNTFDGTIDDYARRIHPEDRDAALDRAMQALQSRAATHHVVHRLITPHGEVRWLESHARFFYAPDGTPLRLVGVSTDVTEKKQMELARDAALAAAERARADLQRIFAQAPAAICTLSGPDLVVQSMNALFIAMVGPRDALGKPIREAFPDLEGQPFIALLEEVYRSGEPFVGREVPASVDRGGGEPQQGFFNFVYQPLFGPTDEVIGVLIHAVEVTDQVRARQQIEETAEELRRLTVALERSNRDLDQFAYVTSHDLKAPLRGIANLATWIEEDGGDQLPESAREHFRLLRGRVARMEALIDGILAYSRAGRLQRPLEVVPVAELVHDVIELLAPGPDVTIAVAPDLPAVRADRIELQQVLQNLIANALRHGRAGAPRVEVGWRDGGTHFEFFVRDNGPGIALEFHDRIWGIFQTLESRDRVESTGIGLSVVKRIVETRGGRVWVESAPGAGATFYITWPKTYDPEPRQNP